MHHETLFFSDMAMLWRQTLPHAMRCHASGGGEMGETLLLLVDVTGEDINGRMGGQYCIVKEISRQCVQGVSGIERDQNI